MTTEDPIKPNTYLGCKRVFTQITTDLTYFFHLLNQAELAHPDLPDLIKTYHKFCYQCEAIFTDYKDGGKKLKDYASQIDLKSKKEHKIPRD